MDLPILIRIAFNTKTKGIEAMSLLLWYLGGPGTLQEAVWALGLFEAPLTPQPHISHTELQARKPQAELSACPPQALRWILKNLHVPRYLVHWDGTIAC